MQDRFFGGLVCSDNNILVMKIRQVLCNIFMFYFRSSPEHKHFILCWVKQLCYLSIRLLSKYFMHVLVRTSEMMLDRSFNINFRCIDNVPTLNNSLFADCIHTCVAFIFIELQIKLTNNNTTMSASFLYIDRESLLRAKMYDKRLFIIPNASFFIYICIWSIYLSVDTMFQIL